MTTTRSAKNQDTRIPVVLVGIVQKAQGIDFCMDGADYVMVTFPSTKVRLRGTNDEVNKRLSHFAGTRLRVTVIGYPVWGPECSHVEVYSASPAEEVLAQLGFIAE